MVLKIDHDAHNSRRLALAELVRRAERANLTILKVWQRRSASGKGWHRVLVVTPPPETASRCVALQLLFGSDPLREAYNYNRVCALSALAGSAVADYWADHWNVLFTSADGWRLVTAKVLTAHRERNRETAPRTPRGIERKG